MVSHLSQYHSININKLSIKPCSDEGPPLWYLQCKTTTNKKQNQKPSENRKIMQNSSHRQREKATPSVSLAHGEKEGDATKHHSTDAVSPQGPQLTTQWKGCSLEDSVFLFFFLFVFKSDTIFYLAGKESKACEATLNICEKEYSKKRKDKNET